MGRAVVIPEFWLFLPQLRMSFSKIISRAQDAERAGFDGVALIDHLAPPGRPDAAMYDAMTTAAAIAASTGRLRVTHLVLCGPFRHPALLAKEAIMRKLLTGETVDYDGRFYRLQRADFGEPATLEAFAREVAQPLQDASARIVPYK